MTTLVHLAFIDSSKGCTITEFMEQFVGKPKLYRQLGNRLLLATKRLEQLVKDGYIKFSYENLHWKYRLTEQGLKYIEENSGDSGTDIRIRNKGHSVG